MSIQLVYEGHKAGPTRIVSAELDALGERVHFEEVQYIGPGPPISRTHWSAAVDTPRALWDALRDAQRREETT